MAYAEGPKKGFIYPPGYIDFIQSALEVTETNRDRDKIYFRITGWERFCDAHDSGIQLTIGYYHDDGSGSWTQYKEYKTVYWSTDNNWYPSGGLVYDDYFYRQEGVDRQITFYAEAKGIQYQGGGSYGGRKSEANVTMTVPKIDKMAPEPPTNPTATYVSDNQIDITWTNNPQTNKPVEGTWLDRQVNDGSYCASILPDNYMSTSWSDKDALIQANSRIKYRLKHYNSVGGSADYVYTNFVDTTPASPQQVVAMQTGTKVSLQAITNNIRYPDHYEWQRASTGAFADAVNLSTTEASFIDTTTINKPWYRVRCVGTGGLKSAWVACQASKDAQIFVNLPPGATMKAIYIRKP